MAQTPTPDVQGSAEKLARLEELKESAGQASLATALDRWQSEDVELLGSPLSPRTGEQLQNSAGEPVFNVASVTRHSDDVEQEASRSPPRPGDQLEDLAPKL